ncbi:hypothetical protein V8D89_002212 [Ganoderma adspersum]
MNIQDVSSFEELHAKVSLVIYGEHADTARNGISPNRAAAARAGICRDEHSAPDNSLVMKEFLEGVLNVSPTIALEHTFIELYHYLHSQPLGQCVGFLQLRQFAEEYSLTTRVKRKQIVDQTLYGELALFDRAKRALFEASEAHDQAGVMGTELLLQRALDKVEIAKMRVKSLIGFANTCNDELSSVVECGTFWGRGLLP